VIDIPNIGYDTFTAMMHYIYVGSVEVEQDQALPLLQVRAPGTLLWSALRHWGHCYRWGNISLAQCRLSGPCCVACGWVVDWTTSDWTTRR